MSATEKDELKTEKDNENLLGRNDLPSLWELDQEIKEQGRVVSVSETMYQAMLKALENKSSCDKGSEGSAP